MDAFPVVSQIKSAVQAAFGDLHGARETQINFSRRCPIVSQIRSAVEAAKGDQKAARKTQKECGGFILSLVEGTPVVGHAIGTGYYIAGNKECGDAAMKSASRSAGVIVGGAVGLLVGGPVGSVAGGSIAGVTMDGLTTGIDSAVHKSFRPQGVFAPAREPKNVGIWIDSFFLIGIDSLTGFAVGRSLGGGKAITVKEVAANFIKNPKTSTAELLKNFRSDFSFNPTSAINVARLSKMSIQFFRDGLRWYQTFEKTELGGVIVTAVTAKTHAMIREAFDNLQMESSKYSRDNSDQATYENESKQESQTTKGRSNSKTKYELNSENENTSDLKNESRDCFSIPNTHNLDQAVKSSKDTTVSTHPEERILIGFCTRATSLESLKDLENEYDKKEEELNDNELGCCPIVYEEITIKGRKLYAIDFLKKEEENHTIKRSLSCYF